MHLLASEQYIDSITHGATMKVKMYKLLTVPVETLLEALEPKANTGGEQHGVT